MSKASASRSKIEPILQKALAAHQKGLLEEAKHLYQQVLEVESNHVTALSNLGSLFARIQNFDEALRYYQIALKNPSVAAETWFNYGNLQQKLGMNAEAEQSFQSALERNPNLYPAFYNLGNLLRDRQAYDEASAHYLHAIALNPKFSKAHRNLGNLYRQTEKYTRAVEHHRISVTLEPEQAEAYLSLANALWDADQQDEAVMQYRAALKRAPDLQEATLGLGNALKKRADSLQKNGESASALPLYDEVLALQPARLDALNARGVALNSLARKKEAEQAWLSCLKVNPDYVAALINLGTLNRLEKQHEVSLRYLRKAVSVAPDDVDSVTSLASSLIELGSVSEALHQIAKVEAENTEHGDLLSMKAYAYAQQARIDEAQVLLAHVRKVKPNNTVAISNSLFSSLYSDSLTPIQLTDLHGELSEQINSTTAPSLETIAKPNAHKRLRIGYLSPDFRSHPVGFFIDPVLRCHNKEDFHITCYALPSAKDAHTQQLQSYGHEWRDVAGLNSAQIATQIKKDGIDILVDLAGHTAGGRPDLIKCRAAPVQAVFIGYPYTTGIKEMDYLIADSHLVPPRFEHLYTEKIGALAHSFLCYQAQAETPKVAPLPALSNAYITFGSYNNLPKVSHSCLTLWAEVLKAVPNSRLAMMASSLADDGTRHLFQSHFAKLGIAEQRIILLPPVTPLSRFLAQYERIDIALDTVPYNGGTTSCDALYMGCPVVTLEGETFIGRMGTSLLTTLGRREWIAQSRHEYVDIAKQLAANISELSNIRGQLRAQMVASGLGDAKAYTHDLESLYKSWIHAPKQ